MLPTAEDGGTSCCASAEVENIGNGGGRGNWPRGSAGALTPGTASTLASLGYPTSDG